MDIDRVAEGKQTRHRVAARKSRFVRIFHLSLVSEIRFVVKRLLVREEEKRRPRIPPRSRKRD